VEAIFIVVVCVAGS